MIKVKICGITTLEDALFSIEHGADALGFVFAKSPRQISPAQAEKIIRKLPPFIERVGVFVDEIPHHMQKLARELGLTAVQLHGREIPEFCAHLHPLTVIKSINVNNKNDINIISAYNSVHAILLDSFVAGKNGGSGKTFDWSLAKLAVKFDKPIILSGGLTAKNVKEAIKKVNPYGVDVSSGVESKPGKKDKKKIAEFLKAAKGK